MHEKVKKVDFVVEVKDGRIQIPKKMQMFVLGQKVLVTIEIYGDGEKNE